MISRDNNTKISSQPEPILDMYVNLRINIFLEH